MIRFAKILCPVDFFPASHRAFEYALKLAANYGASVHALHVVAPIVYGDYGTPFQISDITAEVEKQSKQEMRKLQIKAEKSKVPTLTEVRLGEIDAGIGGAIRRKRPDLVVMGTHGRRGFERWAMGSVAERLMRHCPVPILVIRSEKAVRPAPPAIRRILVTTDFSVGTADALDYAFSLAQECQAKITLLHVVDDAAAELTADSHDRLLRDIRRKLDEMVPEEARSWCDVKTRIEAGIPYRVILDILKSERIGLLIMNVHGKGMLERALVGSTAERVVRAAECPVMLIPPMQAKRRKRAKSTNKAA